MRGIRKTLSHFFYPIKRFLPDPESSPHSSLTPLRSRIHEREGGSLVVSFPIFFILPNSSLRGFALYLRFPHDNLAGIGIVPERRKRATQADITEALCLLMALPVHIDSETAAQTGDIAALALQYGLTVYDAAYLELAMRHGSSLATTDLALAKAAKSAGVSIFP